MVSVYTNKIHQLDDGIASRLSFVANLSDVSLDERVDFLDIDFAGFVVTNLLENYITFRWEFEQRSVMNAYLRNSLSKNLLVFFFRDVLLIIMRFKN